MEIAVDRSYDAEELNDIPIEELCEFVLTMLDKPASCEVTVTFVDDERMRTLNREHRGIDRSTDVLSFECDGYDDDFDADLTLAQISEMPYLLGDIVIAPDVAHRQMSEYGTTFEEEITTLCVHGLLHLNGYDHIDPEDAKIMLPLQDKLIEAWEQRNA